MNDTAPYVPGSDTSYDAAKSIEEHLPHLERLVRLKIQEAGAAGRTDDEIEEMTGLRHQSASARRRGLVLKNLIVDSGTRRKTRSGRFAAVWIDIRFRFAQGEETP